MTATTRTLNVGDTIRLAGTVTTVSEVFWTNSEGAGFRTLGDVTGGFRWSEFDILSPAPVTVPDSFIPALVITDAEVGAQLLRMAMREEARTFRALRGTSNDSPFYDTRYAAWNQACTLRGLIEDQYEEACKNR